MLKGYSRAEDGVLYPALSDAGEKGHATIAYTEQSAAKMQLGMREHLDPMSQDYLDKFGHLEGAVKHHVYAEESNWFVDLKKLPDDVQQYLTLRYKEEFSRYMGADMSETDREALDAPNFASGSSAEATSAYR